MREKIKATIRELERATCPETGVPVPHARRAYRCTCSTCSRLEDYKAVASDVLRERADEIRERAEADWQAYDRKPTGVRFREYLSNYLQREGFEGRYITAYLRTVVDREADGSEA